MADAAEIDLNNVDIEALALQIFLHQNRQMEAMMMAAARLAALEVMAMEGDDGDMEDGLVADNVGDWWVPVTVLINEYHTFGDPCFKIHFRMTRGVFELLVTTVREHLVRKNRLQVERTPLQDIMLMVVWLLATPDSFRSVALRFGVNPGTLYYFYYYVIEALREMGEVYIKWPDADERRAIREQFERVTGFPGVIGSVDGTHVFITAPLQNAAQYVNRYSRHSINVQAIVDNNLLVRHVHVGEVGSMHDNRVFRRSRIFRELLSGPPGEFIDADEHIVGDGAYTQSDFLIPFQNDGHLTPAQQNYNRRLSQCRVRVENAFGRAKGKWRRLFFLHARKQDVIVDHITASFVLHNFVILNGEPLLNEEQLGRPVANNEILGGEDFVDEALEDEDLQAEDLQDLQELIVAANARGLEKRIFYMNNVLPQ